MQVQTERVIKTRNSAPQREAPLAAADGPLRPKAKVNLVDGQTDGRTTYFYMPQHQPFLACYRPRLSPLRICPCAVP